MASARSRVLGLARWQSSSSGQWAHDSSPFSTTHSRIGHLTIASKGSGTRQREQTISSARIVLWSFSLSSRALSRLNSMSSPSHLHLSGVHSALQ